MTDVGQRRGRFGAGLAQALGVWLCGLVLAAVVRELAVAWTAVVGALLACVLLGRWHQRRSRPDSAVGAFAGAVLWPVVIFFVIITIGIVADDGQGSIR